jgi:hypothetical protein
MDKPSIAVWLLSLATDPARAATTVGDFSEEASSQKPGWFWLQIARTLGAHIVHDFAAAPGRLLLSLLAGVAYFLAAYAVLLLAMVRLPQVMDVTTMRTAINVFAELYMLTALIATGQCIARVSRRPIAAWVALGVCCAFLWGTLALITHSLPGFLFLLLLLPVLIGAIWERRRSLRHA